MAAHQRQLRRLYRKQENLLVKMALEASFDLDKQVDHVPLAESLGINRQDAWNMVLDFSRREWIHGLGDGDGPDETAVMLTQGGRDIAREYSRTAWERFWTEYRHTIVGVTCPPKPDPGVMRVSTGPQAQEMTLDETQATQSRPDHPEVA